MPRQMGQTLVLGGAPNSLAQPHHILDLVLSWTCVSSPMTTSYSIALKKYYKGDRGIDYAEGPLTPALFPSEGEREKHRPIRCVVHVRDHSGPRMDTACISNSDFNKLAKNSMQIRYN